MLGGKLGLARLLLTLYGNTLLVTVRNWLRGRFEGYIQKATVSNKFVLIIKPSLQNEVRDLRSNHVI